MSLVSRSKTEVVPNPVDEALRQYGVPVVYEGVGGVEFEVPTATKQALLASLQEALADQPLVLPPDAPPASTAAKCYFPGAVGTTRAWGISLQLYELCSSRNWGIGDLEDLARVCELAAASGASFVGLTPLHALFLADPNRCSPYSPSNRRFLNPIYIAVDQLAYASASHSAKEQLPALRNAELVDYEQVARVKLAALREQWTSWKEGEWLAEKQQYRAFKKKGNEDLLSHALFEALSLHMAAAGYGSGWKNWPEGYRRRSLPDVDDFLRENSDEVEFHLWLQWIASTQLQNAAERGKRAGLTFGLYFDYAVGEDPDGSATWSNPSDYLAGFSIGAPPDPFSEAGQDWGLSVPSPIPPSGPSRQRIMEQFDRVMELGGMFRLDHAMGLWQLFLVPIGKPAIEGAYLRYHIDDMLNLLAESSRRNGTVVIGEDLGNVPPGFRELMQSAKILSYRVLYFEDLVQQTIADFPALSLICASTHDLYPLKGWWNGIDIERRVELGLFSSASGELETQDRLLRKEVLLNAINRENLSLKAYKADAPLTDDLICDIHALLARSPSMLLAVRLADLMGEMEATNIPGTAADHNWRRKISIPIEAWEHHALFKKMTDVLMKERPR
ncbi:4-alpha-glucanotransferase [Oryzifoliimicrobium ureilyticus]|uniref:4-alpha-glucanotransferase n=1 Tax=Oryzifoliimicrobium ureilyticus TaxID=3113724 RepID=UPI0030768703